MDTLRGTLKLCYDSSALAVLAAVRLYGSAQHGEQQINFSTYLMELNALL